MSVSLSLCLPPSPSGCLCLPLSPTVSLCLPPSPFVCLRLPLSPCVSLRLSPSPSVSLCLLPSPSVSARLPPSPAFTGLSQGSHSPAATPRPTETLFLNDRPTLANPLSPAHTPLAEHFPLAGELYNKLSHPQAPIQSVNLVFTGKKGSLGRVCGVC